MNTLRRKGIAAVLLAFFLFLLGSAGMPALGVHQALEREASRNARKVESISELIQMRSEETGIAMENYLGNNRNNVRFMSSALEFFAEGDRYEGDWVFSDGFVIERRGDEIIYPSELKKPPVEITAELIDRALEDPDNFAGYVPKTGGGPQIMPYEPTMTLRIATECADVDYLEVKRYVNREIFLLCGRRDIRTI